MEKDLTNLRQTYVKNTLEEQHIGDDPMALFTKWFDEALETTTIKEANAMSLSTFGADGFPKTRVVLLKKVIEHGFIFYTNYRSEKGQAIAECPQVCLSFFWAPLERQVIIKGTAEKISKEDSEAYFYSRPKGSQLSAFVSPQSEEIPNRAFLEKKVSILESEYKKEKIPFPKKWGGYLVRPISIEFWQGRENRLHDRILFDKVEDHWSKKRLAP